MAACVCLFVGPLWSGPVGLSVCLSVRLYLSLPVCACALYSHVSSKRLFAAVVGLSARTDGSPTLRSDICATTVQTAVSWLQLSRSQGAGPSSEHRAFHSASPCEYNRVHVPPSTAVMNVVLHTLVTPSGGGGSLQCNIYKLCHCWGHQPQACLSPQRRQACRC